MKTLSSAVLFALVGAACVAGPIQAEAGRHQPDGHLRVRPLGERHLGARQLVARHVVMRQRGTRQVAARHNRDRGAGVGAVSPMQRGIASVYGERFHGRTMADGTRFDPISNAAASKSLPLGTTAQVTNLQNGRSAIVQVRDRGPHRRGRIIDLSPGSASALGMDRHSTAPVTVSPVGPRGVR